MILSFTSLVFVKILISIFVICIFFRVDRKKGMQWPDSLLNMTWNTEILMLNLGNPCYVIFSQAIILFVPYKQNISENALTFLDYRIRAIEQRLIHST